MRDKYDDAIEYLTTNPDKIFETWAEPQRRKGGCLFSAVTPSGRIWEERDDGQTCGCLTQIRGRDENTNERLVAWTTELTTAIRADDRLPNSECGITVENLPVFAEWQRKIDLILERK